jgi:hypothetical protein
MQAQEIYQAGIEAAEMSYDEIADHYPEIWDAYANNDVRQIFTLGRLGRPLLRVRGWRYGDIPVDGYSHNYRDQCPEDGVSLMALDGDEPTLGAQLYEACNGGREKIHVSGYFAGYGSDGEPLIVCARRTDDAH